MSVALQLCRSIVRCSISTCRPDLMLTTDPAANASVKWASSARSNGCGSRAASMRKRLSAGYRLPVQSCWSRMARSLKYGIKSRTVLHRSSSRSNACSNDLTPTSVLGEFLFANRFSRWQASRKVSRVNSRRPWASHWKTMSSYRKLLSFSGMRSSPRFSKCMSNSSRRSSSDVESVSSESVRASRRNSASSMPRCSRHSFRIRPVADASVFVPNNCSRRMAL